MRKEPESPWVPVLDRLRGSWGRTRRWLAGRGVATRVGLAAGGLMAVGGLGYLAVGGPTVGPATAALYDGRKLSADEQVAIKEALDAEAILCVRDNGRFFVKADRKAAALAAIAKRKATPASLDELNRDNEPESPWITQAERDRHDQARLERILKRQIEGLDAPILSAQVSIHRERARGLAQHRTDVHAYVYLEIEPGRKLADRTVQGIETFLVGAVPGLMPDSITVADQGGHKYMAAGDAPLKEQVKKHSQEDEWADRITEGLRHIPGVGVTVSLESVAEAPPAVEAPPAAPVAEVAVANGALEVAPEPKFVAAPVPPPPPRTRANVWVRVPRSFYIRAAQSQTPGRQPSAEDLQQMRETTIRIAHEAVGASIPREMLGEVKVDTIQDDLTTARSVVLPPDPAEPNQAWLIPAVASGAGLAAVASVVAGVRLASKRPAARMAGGWRPGFVADGPNPGPSERVRELIRLNPEAAAGVLQRWVGQGGAVG